MNKKILMFAILPLLCLVLVSAITYYAVFTATLNISSAITLDNEEQTLENLFDGGITKGEPIIITNHAPTERTTIISGETECNIETGYEGSLELSQKVVDFGLDKWELLTDGDTATIEYTLIGDSFTAEVIDGEKVGYELIYYKDNSDRFNSPAEAIGITTITSNLPYDDDANTGENDYCETGEYDTCQGSKIWYVPSNALTGDVIDWGRASEFLFETKLIQYNAEGNIIIYAESDLVITPLYDIAVGEEGTCVVETTIA